MSYYLPASVDEDVQDVHSDTEETITPVPPAPREPGGLTTPPGRFVYHINVAGAAQIDGTLFSKKENADQDYFIDVGKEGRLTLLNSSKQENSSSIFSAFGLQRDIATQPGLMIASKKQWRARRQPENSDTNLNITYAPYAKVTNPNIRRALFRIADRFDFLDRGFAEYFRAVGPSFDRQYIEEALHAARKSIETRVAFVRHEPCDAAYIGDLGQYCELVFAAWASEQGVSGSSFKATDKRDGTLDNLQDAFEIPYWEFIADLFDDVR